MKFGGPQSFLFVRISSQSARIKTGKKHTMQSLRLVYLFALSHAIGQNVRVLWGPTASATPDQFGWTTAQFNTANEFINANV